MKIPCVEKPDWVVQGLSFLLPILSTAQFNNITLVASALILGSNFKLSEISSMWLGKKGISALSYFFSSAKISIEDMQRHYIVRTLSLYNLAQGGYFIIDDTMKHHSRFCRWIHGACCLFDHVLGTNLKVTCVVFLYYSDGGLIKFPITWRIFYQEQDKQYPWQKGKKFLYKAKSALALEMIEWALQQGFPKSTVLADSWYCVAPFVEGLQRLKLSYVLAMKENNTIVAARLEPKLTPNGRLCKHQQDSFSLEEYFKTVLPVVHCGLPYDLENEKPAKVLYHTKTTTVKLNALPQLHRVVQSVLPAGKFTKYFLTDQLNWEAHKILSIYAKRWVIEEFFRNAKQLSDMEGASLRSEQGVALSLCLVSWIDFLLHHRNYQSTAKKLSKEPLSVPSILREAQMENAFAFLKKVQTEDSFVREWVDITQRTLYRKRKPYKDLIPLDAPPKDTLSLAA